MDVDHLLLDLDKAAMRYYLNKNVSEDDTKPAANVSGAGGCCFPFTLQLCLRLVAQAAGGMIQVLTASTSMQCIGVHVDLARVTELVFQMLVEDPAFANREIR
eukprot:544895-Pelagomonas_calceolata.AAC.6